ncbi:MAG: disulfide bond formation protein B [Patescibacteria group bacterium]
MPQFVQIANLILSLLTVVAQILSVVLIIGLITRNGAILKLFSRRAIVSAGIVALVATVGSLFYSESAGYDPCKLCWFQRILMYPQVILFGLALAGRLRDYLVAAGTLSGIGALVAGYHYLLQIGVITGGNCGAVGYSAACSQRFVMNFGYITIPMMALSAFLLILLISIAAHKTATHENTAQKNHS